MQQWLEFDGSLEVNQKQSLRVSHLDLESFASTHVIFS